MFTRKHLMNKECTHSEYYAQLSEPFKEVLRRTNPAIEWKRLIEEDEHLNNINLSFWDTIATQYSYQVAALNKKIYGKMTWSLSDGVCAAKEAARQIAMEAANE